MFNAKSPLYAELNTLLCEGYQMWERFGCIPLNEMEKHAVLEQAVNACQTNAHTKEYAAACQCFFLYRKLHHMVDEQPECATLLGDYYFSQFSQCLIPIDSPKLIDLFAEYLKNDTKIAASGNKVFDMEKYLVFVSKAAEEIGL